MPQSSTACSPPYPAGARLPTVLSSCRIARERGRQTSFSKPSRSICIGIVCAGVVLVGTDFGGARQRLATQLAVLAAEIADRLSEAFSVVRSDQADTRVRVFNDWCCGIADAAAVLSVKSRSGWGWAMRTSVRSIRELFTRALRAMARRGRTAASRRSITWGRRARES